MKNKLRGSLSILAATIIWGTAFVAQSVGMDHIGPFTFQACRCILAVLSLVILVWVFDRKHFWEGWKNKKLWVSGSLCGIALLFATNLQQVGMVYTDAGKAGFLTAMYIVLVPIIGAVLGKRPSKTAIISVVPAVAGLYLLSCVGVSKLNIGDILMICCAVCFSVQILLVDRLAGDLDSLRLNCVQCMVCVVGSCLGALTEPFHWAAIWDCAVPIAYAGVLSLAVAYSLQIVGQKHMDPTVASLMMSLESVFALIGGQLILKERMAWWEWIGCALMLGSVILSQLPDKKARCTT